jgi:GDP-4-dehydro-6-deoxy-D-mannose reductase
MTSVSLRVLVTGAEGFVGRHLTRALAAAFPDAVLLTPRFDITAAIEAASIVRAAAPNACIHLAAISTIAMARQDADRVWQVNLHGTLHLARAILLHAPECQLVFASTAEAYGASYGRAAKLDEGFPLAPRNIYAATKAAADLALGSMAKDGLRVVRLRAVNHTGPGQGPQFVVPALARQVARIAARLQEPIVHVGNLESRRDLLDVRDVCAAYIGCIARRDVIEPGTILNLASGEARRIGDVLEQLQRLAGVSAQVRIDPSRVRTIDVPSTCGDAGRAREVLGWTPRTPWRQTLLDVLDDWRERIAADPETA